MPRPKKASGIDICRSVLLTFRLMARQVVSAQAIALAKTIIVGAHKTYARKDLRRITLSMDGAIRDVLGTVLYVLK